MHLRSLLSLTVLLAGCGGDPGVRMRSGIDWHSYVKSRDGGSVGSDFEGMRFRPNLCDPEELRPEYGKLDETSLIRFFEKQHLDARIERPRADLTYLVVGGASTDKPVWLRVATLANANEAAHELHQAMLQHGPGSWGVHRSNLAVLGPVSAPSDAIGFAGLTKLACWGVFTIAGTDDAFVVPGGYTEL